MCWGAPALQLPELRTDSVCESNFYIYSSCKRCRMSSVPNMRFFKSEESLWSQQGWVSPAQESPHHITALCCLQETTGNPWRPVRFCSIPAHHNQIPSSSPLMCPHKHIGYSVSYGMLSSRRIQVQPGACRNKDPQEPHGWAWLVTGDMSQPLPWVTWHSCGWIWLLNVSTEGCFSCLRAFCCGGCKPGLLWKAFLES